MRTLLFILSAFSASLLHAQPLPVADSVPHAHYVFTVYQPTHSAEQDIWRTQNSRLTTHRLVLNDSSEIRLPPASVTTLRTFVDLGAAAGAVQGNQESGAPEILDLLSYGELLSPEQRQLTESYLAIKHGLTLDQNFPTNYLAPTKTGTSYPVWTATEKPDFSHRIVGLAYDELSGINRSSGHSVHAPELLNISWLNQATETSYLIVADNNQPTAWGPALPGAPGYKPLLREWKVEATGAWQETTLTLSPRQLFEQLEPGQTWALLVSGTANHPNGETFTHRPILPTRTAKNKLQYRLPAGTQSFRIAMTCTVCDHQPPEAGGLFEQVTVSPNPVRAGSPVQLRAALSDASSLRVSVLDISGRVVEQRWLPAATHHLAEFTFPYPGPFTLHLLPSLFSKNVERHTVQIIAQ